MNPERLLAYYERVADSPDADTRMRRFVLDLAARGKLLPQDPNDEPVADLLTRIAKKNAAVIRKNRDLPKIDSEPYALPGSWRWVRLGELGVTQTGATPSKNHPEYFGSDVPFLRPGDLYASHVDYSGGGLSTAGAKASGRLAPSGSILMVCIGTIGKCQFIDRTVSFNQQINALSPYADLNPSFLLRVMQSDHFQRAAWAASARTTIAILNKGNWEQLQLPIPPVAEQQRIVAKVDELMALCARLEAARSTRESTRDRLAQSSLARLNSPDAMNFRWDVRFVLDALPVLTARPDQIKQLRQTILNLAVRGKLVPQEPRDVPVIEYLLLRPDMPKNAKFVLEPLDSADCGGEIPASWAWLPLGALITCMDAGWSPQCEDFPRSNDEEWGVLKTTSVQALAFEPSHNKSLPKKLQPRPQHQVVVEDILVTRAGPKNRVGVSCVVHVPCPRLMISDKLIRFHALGDLSARYLAIALNAGYTLGQIDAAKSGMAVMQMNISQDKLRAVPIPVPPIAEQHRIVPKVDELMAVCDRLEASLASGDETRSRLLHTLLAEALEPDESREMEAVA